MIQSIFLLQKHLVASCFRVTRDTHTEGKFDLPICHPRKISSSIDAGLKRLVRVRFHFFHFFWIWHARQPPFDSGDEAFHVKHISSEAETKQEHTRTLPHFRTQTSKSSISSGQVNYGKLTQTPIRHFGCAFLSQP